MVDLRDTRRFWGIGEVLKLSWPASLSMLNSTVMRFVDGLMVSFIGPTPFAAQLVGGMASFVPESFATGLLSVVNTYVAQNFGAKRLEKCGQYAWAGLYLALAFCLLVVPLIFFARPIFSAFNAEQLQLKQQAVQQAQSVNGCHGQDATAGEVPRYCLVAVRHSTPGGALLQTTQQWHPEDQAGPQKLRQAQAELKEVRDLRDLEIMYFRYMVAAIFLTLTARPHRAVLLRRTPPASGAGGQRHGQPGQRGAGYMLIFGTPGLVGP